MLSTISIATKKRNEFIDITHHIQNEIIRSNVKEGYVIVYNPHTTAGITINEGADPEVVRDIMKKLSDMIPEHGDYHHSEGNSDSHIKSSLIGVSQLIPFSGKKLFLGQWQSIFFCEFDGPRSRRFHIMVCGNDQK